METLPLLTEPVYARPSESCEESFRIAMRAHTHTGKQAGVFEPQESEILILFNHTALHQFYLKFYCSQHHFTD